MNRFYDSSGDLSTQLSPWLCKVMGFDPKLSIFRLEAPLRFRSDIAGGDIVVPVGFLSDLASIPRVAWTLFADPDANFMEMGAWIHDLLYQNVGVVPILNDPVVGWVHLSRKDADRVLAFEAMPDLGAAKWQQDFVYWALRLGGKSSWNTSPPKVRWG